MKHILIIAVLCLAACLAFPQDYARLYADNGNTCQYPDTVLKPPLRLKWRYFAEGSFKGSPTVFNGRLFASDRQGQLYCLDAETGDLLWTRYFLSAGYYNPNDLTPLAWGDYLYYFESGRTNTDQAGYLKCVRQDNGQEVWTAGPIGRHWYHPHFSPLIFNGTIYMCGALGLTAHYWCFDALTGAEKWEKSYSYPADAVALMVQDMALCTLGTKPFLIGSHGSEATENWINKYGLTFALTADSGRELWQTPDYFNGRRFSVYDTLLYMKSCGSPTFNRTVAASVFSGDTVWSANCTFEYYTTPAVDSLYLYTRAYGSNVYVYNRFTGAAIGTCDWSAIGIPAGGQVLSGCGNMVLGNGYGYCGFGHGGIVDAAYVPPGGSPRSGRAQGIYAYEIPQGPSVTSLKVVWYYKMASNMCTTPAICNGRLYVTTNNEGAIYCFENDQ